MGRPLVRRPPAPPFTALPVRIAIAMSSNTRSIATRRFAAASRDPQIWRRTLLLGLPVGLLQATLNQGDHWWRHAIDSVVVLKTILSPLISCAIVFISSAAAQPAKTDPPTSS